MRLNSEDFPTFGKPTMPIFKLLFTRPKRLADFCAGGGAALGGMAFNKMQRTSLESSFDSDALK
jgi:hypothetical protein